MKKSVFILTLFFLFALAGISSGEEAAGSQPKKLDKKSILFPSIPPQIDTTKPQGEAFQTEERKEFERKKTEKELREERRKERLELERSKEEDNRRDEAEGRFD